MSTVQTFSIKHGVTIVETEWPGYSKGAPWIPDVRRVEGHASSFLMLNKSDRGLCRAMGMDMNKNNPMTRAGELFNHLGRLRDAAIDEYINRSQIQADPMGETSSASKIMIAKGREKLFVDTNVPPTLPITIAAFIATDGARIPSKTFEIQTVPRRGVNPCIEFNVETLAWMARAIHEKWPVPKRPTRGMAGLPDLEPPLKWRRRGNTLSIFITHRRDGKKTTHQQTVAQKGIDDDAMKVLLKQATTTLMERMETLGSGDLEDDAADPDEAEFGEDDETGAHDDFAADE